MQWLADTLLPDLFDVRVQREAPHDERSCRKDSRCFRRPFLALSISHF